MSAEHPYLDAALSPEQRTEDLLSRMSLEDKAGQLFHSQIGMGPGGSLADADPVFSLPSTEEFVRGKRMSHFNLLGVVDDPRQVATWHNRLQELAADTPLGIPVTLSTDPRHHFTDNPGTAFNAGAVSQWPETLGFAALRSADRVQEFANIARQEYLALGFRLALHPQVDLATEPRWSRINTTFGEDAGLTSELAVAYVRGLQGPALGPESVSTMTKHFPGGGPQLDGEDPHFHYGREQIYPGDNFEYHLTPFAAVIQAGGSQIMPYYGMPVGTALEPVAFGFNKGVITGLLRERFGFDGIVCTDWGLINDAELLGAADAGPRLGPGASQPAGAGRARAVGRL
jgi:beta-glucosidase